MGECLPFLGLRCYFSSRSVCPSAGRTDWARWTYSKTGTSVKCVGEMTGFDYGATNPEGEIDNECVCASVCMCVIFLAAFMKT